MKIGDTLNYFGKSVEVVAFDKNHVLILFENGTKICVSKSLFE